MKKIFLYLFVFSLSGVYNASSQSQFTGWLAMFNTFKTGKRTSIHNDIQWRSSDEFQHTQTFLFRTGLNFQIKKNILITGGYAFIHNRRTTGIASGYLPEHRIWEQLVLTHKLKTALVSHRFRLEQRFISSSIVQGNSIKKDGTVYANRFRYFIRDVLPFKKQATFKKGVFVALQNEVFLNIGNTANVNGQLFDQNRLYLAVGYRLSPSFDLETGYLNQYSEGPNSSTNNHVIQLAGYIRL
jgi:hypothetical protein